MGKRTLVVVVILAAIGCNNEEEERRQRVLASLGSAKERLEKATEGLVELRRQASEELQKDTIEQLERFRADMCACYDRPCAEKVSKAMDDWAKSQGEEAEKAMKAMPEDMKQKAMAIAEAMGRCMSTARGGY